MMDHKNILDLDVSKSIKDFEKSINTQYSNDTIYKLIELVKFFGQKIGTIYLDFHELTQYALTIKYLKCELPLVFEFDCLHQFINVVYYNNDQTKTYLKFFLSINDDPTIKYVENDHSGIIPSYQDKNIKLKPGEYLINLCHCLATFIGFYRIRLDDDSYLITKDTTGNEMRTKLWLYYLITKGKSWYAKFGYEPGNSNVHEYLNNISDARNIRLDSVCLCLKKILFAPNKDYLDDVLVTSAEKIVDLIGLSNETLHEYTTNHTLEEFTDLTNNLTQSIFARSVSIRIINTKQIDEVSIEKQINDIPIMVTPKIKECNSESDDDDTSDDDTSDDDCESQYYNLEFPWYGIFRKLLVVNVIQVNNNVNKHYYRLS